MSRASSLFRLQETDLALDAGRARLAEIAQALAGNPAVQAAQARARQAEAQLHKAKAALTDAELDQQTLADKIAADEARLYGGRIRNPKELQDLQAEVESLKRRRAAAEERQLEALLEYEDAEAQLKAARDHLNEAEAEARRTSAALTAEWDRLTAREADLQAERESLLTTIAAADRAQYEKLRHAKKGRALARLEDGVCAACGMEPTAADRQLARRGAELVLCAGCGRILYAE
jgi:predicted  nucleic acid-binding Zn-ribbon protein